MLPDAMARPIPITLDPTYSGWANHRYGPDAVTSRDLRRCPAAQIRSASPTPPTQAPAATVHAVGSDSQSTIAPQMNPRNTRKRARILTTPTSRMRRRRHQTPFDRGKHFGLPDV